MKTKRKVILTFILLALFSSALYADGFQWQHFFYRPLDNQPSCVEVRHVSSFENEYPDLTVYEREEARSIYTAFIPETVYDKNQNEYTVISIWGEDAPIDVSRYVYKGAFQGLIPDTIYLPKTIVWIGKYAFFNRSDYLKYVYLPEGIEHIGDNAFACNTALDSVVLPNKLKQVSNGIFYECESLKSITLPARAESIGNYAFFACASLEHIVLPSTVRSIGKYAFSETALKSIVLPSDCTIGNGIFKDCSQLEKVQLPDNLTDLPDESFLNCKLPAVSLPACLQTIGKKAFSTCELTAIDFPQGLLSIGESAFEGCDYLRTITVRSAEPPVVADKNAFSNYNAVLYVPRGSVEKYAKSPVWCLFRDILPIDEEPVLHHVTFALPSGCIEQDVLEGDKLTLRFIPDDGFSIHSVVCNDEDITDQLDENFTYVTPPVSADLNIVVVFEKGSSNIAATDISSDLRVKISGRRVIITGMKGNDTAHLYNPEGELVGSCQAGVDGCATLSVEKQGLYLVSSSGKSFKFMVR